MSDRSLDFSSMRPFRVREPGRPWAWLTFWDDALLLEEPPLDPMRTNDPMFHAAWMQQANARGPSRWLLHELINKVKAGFVRKRRVTIRVQGPARLQDRSLIFSDRAEVERFQKAIRQVTGV